MRTLPYLPRVLAAAALLVVLTGCGGSNAPAEFFGPAQPLGAGTARTYVTVGADGQPTEVGVRMTTAAMDALPTADRGPSVMLDFPAAAPGTAFTHVMLDWNPHGHEPPGLYGRPHFDFHFDLVDHAVLAAINPADSPATGC